MITKTKKPPKGATKVPPKGQEKAAAPVTAERATHGKHELIVRRVGEKPERWEYRKDGKPIAELDSRDLAKQAAAKDVKAKGTLTWKPMPEEKAGPDQLVLSDADFRAEMKLLAKKVRDVSIKISVDEKEVEGAKARLKRHEVERDALYRQMRDLADDERKGQGRLPLRNDQQKNGSAEPEKKPAPPEKKPAPAPKKK